MFCSIIIIIYRNEKKKDEKKQQQISNWQSCNFEWAIDNQWNVH